MPGTKRCRGCGAELAGDAAFCPRCTATQVARQAQTIPPRRRRGAALALALAGAALLAAVCVPALRREASPEERVVQEVAGTAYERQCQTYYEGEDGTLYHVFTSFSPAGEESESRAMGYKKERLRQDEERWGPLLLYAFDAVTGENAREAFGALVESWQVRASAPEGGDVCRIVAEDADYGAAGALYGREHIVTGGCTYNEIVWTLKLRGGDVITLTQVEEREVRPAAEYRWEDEDMTTAQALQALLDRIETETEPEDAVTVYLPEVVYDAPVYVRRDMKLVGDGTVFSRTLTVEPLTRREDVEATVTVQDVTFTGSGGTGLEVHAPTYVVQCGFSGWDVAVQALDGGWLEMQNSGFDGNGTAVELNSAYADLCGSAMNALRFIRNDVAVRIERMPIEWMELDLSGCSFYGNGADVENPEGYAVRTV